tara:strand:+ start:5611 stop:5742 length:132 start_codon:yes stop_codon:yes gene_type:complete
VKYGYARVSTFEQNMGALAHAACDAIAEGRSELAKLLSVATSN